MASTKRTEKDCLDTTLNNSSCDMANQEELTLRTTEQPDDDENSEDEYLSANGGEDSEDDDISHYDTNIHNNVHERLDSQKSNDNLFGVNKSFQHLGMKEGKDWEGKPEDNHEFPICEDNQNEDSSDEDVAPEDDHEVEILDDADESDSRQKMEEMLSEEEREQNRVEGQKWKDEGNEKFRNGNYDEAIEAYGLALDLCPLIYHKDRSIMYSNRAACKMKKENYESAIKDSTNALELHPTYLKALLRRAELYEKTEKLDEALADFQKVLELDAGNGMARAACMRLPEQIKDRNEKMKEEMIGKLKDLGNLVLRPFGLSTNNFKMQQDPTTGSYSMQFQQNPPGNGT